MALAEAKSRPRAGSQAWRPARPGPGHPPPPPRRVGSQARPRAGRHPRISSELAPAPKAHTWTFQIFPLLALTFPCSITAPPTPLLSYSLSPFIPAQKQGLRAKCVSWLLGKALSPQRGRHERVRVHTGGWRWGGLVTKGPRPRGAGLGGAQTRSLGNDGASLAPRSPVGTEPGATSPKSPALETSPSVTCEPATVRGGVACGIRSIRGACHLRA